MAEGAAGCERKVAMREEIRIAYTATGTGAPIVLIPSLGRGAEDFDAIVPTMAEAGFRVLTPEAQEAGDLQMLLDPAEHKLDVPAGFVELTDLQCAGIEIIGDQGEFAVVTDRQGQAT